MTTRPVFVAELLAGDRIHTGDGSTATVLGVELVDQGVCRLRLALDTGAAFGIHVHDNAVAWVAAEVTHAA